MSNMMIPGLMRRTLKSPPPKDPRRQFLPGIVIGVIILVIGFLAYAYALAHP